MLVAATTTNLVGDH